MHLTVALLVLAPLASASFANLKEGTLYVTTNYPNGTTIHEELANPGTVVTLHKRDYELAAERLAARSKPLSGFNRLQARASEYTACWTPMLIKSSVDYLTNQWRGDLSKSALNLVSEDRSKAISYFATGTFVYYCIDTPRTKGNLDLHDFNKALGKMDSKCVPYQAGWYRWANSNEIVGKTRYEDKFCCGPEGQYC